MASFDKHPLSLLTADEIEVAVTTIKQSFSDVGLRFVKLDLYDAPKKDLVPYLEAERLGQPLPSAPSRYVKTLVRRMDNRRPYLAIIRLNPPEVTSLQEVSPHYYPPADKDESRLALKAVVGHPKVQAEIAKLKLPEGYSVWGETVAFFENESAENPAGIKRFQGFMYLNETDHPGANYYSMPLPIAPVFDAETMELIRIDNISLDDNLIGTPTQPWKPVKAIQHDPSLTGLAPRTDLKPYHVVQPEGASFKVDGNLVEWQKWRFRVGFHTREGLYLQNITYDGRNTFYQLSVPEMAISYGDPRKPFYAKQGFDVGDFGFGVNANSLELGCDCLGTIHYFDGVQVQTDGTAKIMKNIICLHEQDAGIQHKHTNPFTGAVTLARSRELVVQMIVTLGNYDYIFAWILDQAAGIELEIRATGIMSTAPIDNANGRTYPWGTNVGPGVFAPTHQHLFSMRIDPAIDGYQNTVIYEDSVPMPKDPVLNPIGCGHVVENTVVTMSGTVDMDVARNRVFKVRNDDIINKTSQKPVAYKLHLHPSQMLLSPPSNPYFRKAIFSTKPVWVTEYRENELYPNGEFTMQTYRDNDLLTWVDRKDNLVAKDVVIWHTFAFTHNPRTEDFPIMPMEKVRIGLKPSSFFEQNPALDVPRSTQKFNQSTLYVNGGKKEDKASCCK